MPTQKRGEDSPFWVRYAAVEVDVRYAERRKPFSTLNTMEAVTTTMCDLEREGVRRGDMRERLR